MYIIFSLSLSTIFILYVIRNRVVCVTISRPTQTLLLGTAASATSRGCRFVTHAHTLFRNQPMYWGMVRLCRPTCWTFYFRFLSYLNVSWKCNGVGLQLFLAFSELKVQAAAIMTTYATSAAIMSSINNS